MVSSSRVANGATVNLPFQVIAEIKQMPKAELTNVKANCFRHQRLCSTWPSYDSAASFRCHIAGVQCVDWSRMSQSRKGWCGRGAVSFLAWAAERWYYDEDDLLLIECVPSFPHEVLEQILGTQCELRYILASPVQMGIPATRKRKYMCMLQKAHWQWLLDADNDTFARWYAALFCRPCSLLGEALLLASPEGIREHIQAVAVQRGLPKKRSADADWSSYLTLPPTMRQRVKSYEASALERMQRQGSEDVDHGKAKVTGIVNLNQNASDMPCMSSSAPALLTQSRLWGLKCQREILPSEHLTLMGFVAQDATSSALAPYQLEANCRGGFGFNE